MLMSIPKVGEEKAISIIKKYPTIQSLMTAYLVIFFICM
jgi:5'-3' exonuclease